MSKVHIITRLFFFTICFWLCSVMLSCDYFFAGSQFKEQLEKDIAYANASSEQIRIEIDEGSGILLTESILSKKVTDEFTIEFKIASDYEFANWKAFSKKEDGSTETLSSDYINFKTFNTSAIDGIYKANVEFKKSAASIIIKPVCYLLPKVLSSYPPFDNAGYPQDSSVKISFNKPVKLSDFMKDDGSLKNITITNGELNLLEDSNPYYKNPYLEDDGKTLVIPSVPGNYILKDGVMDMNAVLNLEAISDAYDSLAFSQKNYSFVYRVNAIKDSVLPSFSRLNIATTEEDARNGTNLITLDEFSYYAAKVNFDGDSSLVAENIHNHRVNKVWIYFEANDLESGVKELVIEEKLTYNKKGVAENGELYSRSFKNLSGSNSYSNCIEYIFSTPGDGVVELCFNLYDYSGNVLKKKIELVKDTLCLQHYSIGMKKPQDDYYYIGENGFVTCTFSLFVGAGLTWDNFIVDLDGNGYPDNLVFNDESERPIKLVKMQYGSSKENLETFWFDDCSYELNNYGSGSGYGSYKQYSTELTFEGNKDLYVILTSEDYVGNTLTHESVFPASADIATWNETTMRIGSVDKKAWRFQPDTIRRWKLLYVFENNEGVKTEIQSTSGNGSGAQSYYKINNVEIDDLESGVYYFYALLYDSTSSLLNTFVLGKPVVIYHNVPESAVTATEINQDSIPDFSVSADTPVLNAGSKHVRVSINESSELNPNLRYYIEYKNVTSGAGFFSSLFDFDIKTDYSSYEFRIVVQNEVGEIVYSEPFTLDLSFDNIAPYLGTAYHYLYGNAWCIFFPYLDDGEGIGFEKNDDEEIEVKYVTSATALNMTEIDWSNDSRIQDGYIDSFWGLHIPYDGGNAKYIYVKIPDKNGNYCTFETHARDYIYATPTVSCTSGTFNVKNKPIDPVQTNSTAWYFTAWYLSDGKWDITEQIKGVDFYSAHSALYNVSHSFSPVFTETEKQSFIKVTCFNHGYSEGTASFSDYSQYFYPPYYLEANFTCQLKSYMECEDNELAVFADKPCLVQTLYSTKNIGGSEKMLDWITFANEAEVLQKDGSFTYQVPVKNIPDGNYYTTVIHFADGTRKMSAVKQK